MTTPSCPIVGIGASAGGLAALKSLFQALPTDSGAAFVVIQHLDPKHASLTAEILARSTSMPSVQVSDGMVVEPNHVYVIPPNAYLTLQGHGLELGEPVLRHGLRMPIDAFLWSLAEQHEERAVAIIVSGTGSDGALGVRAVKGGGGLVLAQTPEHAQYDGMPRSAIATGMVDFVCPVDAMAEHVTRYLRHPYIKQAAAPEPATEQAVDDSRELNAILALLQTRNGHDFRVYKHGTLRRRIARRMGLHQLETMTEYLAFLRAQEDEATLLFKDLLIGVTAFFRDSEAFDALDEKVIVPLVEKKHTDEPIRVWVAGCASGEEAYSIAMLLVERLAAAHKHCPIQVFASDIDEFALAAGRTGVYPENIAANLSPARLQRFFSKEDHSYRVNKALRETVTFAVQDLISDPPFSNLDLISCRNLLIYLKPDVQPRVLALFHFALREAGYLFLGHSETVSQQQGLFEPLAKQWRIYRRANVTRAPRVDFPIGSAKRRTLAQNIPAAAQASEQVRLNEVAQRYLLQEFAPAAVLVNRQHQVLYFSGPTLRYLQQPSGAPTQDLLSLARPELRANLRLALRQALDKEQRTTVDDAHVMRDGVRVEVKITLKPLTLPRLSDALLMITFEDASGLAVPTRVTTAISADAEASLIQQLESELGTTQDELQSNIEEQESANQELQAANEEVMSVNEELQSSNEELETSKEELQSMNEELTTVNNQLKEKLDELAQSNNDLDNLMTSTDIATLFLDTDLIIGRFTPATRHLMNLISSDVGRPLSDIRQKFSGGDLQADAQRVLDQLTPLESEVFSDAGDCYLLRISPYRTSDNRIDGVVVTFVDISQRKRSERALLSAKALAETANATKSRFLATANHDLRQPLQSLNLLNAALLKISDDPKARKMLTMQGESLNGMGQLLNSLLDISKLESGTVSAAMTDIALQPIFAHLRADFEAVASEKGLQLQVDMTADKVHADTALLAQLLQNLLANAIRYTQHGFVKLSCGHVNNKVRIEVSDSGIGIAEHQLSHIFDEFHQVDRDPQQRHGGLGLGLSIVQRLAGLLGTTVDVKSEVGSGSTFAITLPAAVVTHAEAVKTAVNEAQSVASNGAILLIDDEPAVLGATMERLSLEEDFTITTAASPPAAYALLKDYKPDLIITDFHLGHADSGIDIVCKARECRGRTIPAILVTGDTAASISELKIADMQIMHKPLNAEELVSVARRLLRSTNDQA